MSQVAASTPSFLPETPWDAVEVQDIEKSPSQQENLLKEV